MILVVSPAKTLDYESPFAEVEPTHPQFVDEAQALIKKLKPMSAKKLSKLMSVSPALAALNRDRYEAWSAEFTEANSRPAIYAFKGDVYVGLDALTLSAEDIDYAQGHLRMLSGLYGLLRPLDRMQPYRLEMGTKLAVRSSKNLYQFWDTKITEALNADLAATESEALVNLASNEYFKSVKPRLLSGRVVTPIFKDWKTDRYKVISFFAKKARGAMARFLIQNRVRDLDGLLAFDWDGYAHDAELSSKDEPVFTRKRDA
jgi:cytoplasmic iron level regulating protein YaaA (DUF328/UPF0246 family)